MKQKLTADDILNWWLAKYHNTSIDRVFKDHPEWDVHSKDWNSRVFYEAYPVTQEQHDEWYEWVITTLMKEKGMGRKNTERNFSFVYLNTAPSVKKD